MKWIVTGWRSELGWLWWQRAVGPIHLGIESSWEWLGFVTFLANKIFLMTHIQCLLFPYTFFRTHINRIGSSKGERLTDRSAPIASAERETRKKENGAPTENIKKKLLRNLFLPCQQPVTFISLSRRDCRIRPNVNICTASCRWGGRKGNNNVLPSNPFVVVVPKFLSFINFLSVECNPSQDNVELFSDRALAALWFPMTSYSFLQLFLSLHSLSLPTLSIP